MSRQEQESMHQKERPLLDRQGDSIFVGMGAVINGVLGGTAIAAWERGDPDFATVCAIGVLMLSTGIAYRVRLLNQEIDKLTIQEKNQKDSITT